MGAYSIPQSNWWEGSLPPPKGIAPSSPRTGPRCRPFGPRALALWSLDLARPPPPNAFCIPLVTSKWPVEPALAPTFHFFLRVQVDPYPLFLPSLFPPVSMLFPATTRSPQTHLDFRSCIGTGKR